MDIKYGILFLTILVGSLALPAPDQDMSIFFEHVDPTARIVGGTEAPAGSHPHMVALSSGALVRSFLCGGSIVSIRTVLTAAHCIDHVFSFGSLASSLRATVGTNRWNSGGVNYNLARNVTHPNYVAATIKNDIGLLITTANIVYTPLVAPITINYNNVGAGVNTRVAGWGRIRAGGSLSATLLEINLPTIDGPRCVSELARMAQVQNIRAPPVEPHIELCTFLAVGRGTCNGDSGSALARVDNRQQVGLVSWGLPCAIGAPDVFVRVSAYGTWLRANIV